MTSEDIRMVADRLGLRPEDDGEVRQALEDIDRLGQDGFEDLALREVSTALLAAYAGERPTPAVARRAQVRQAVAVALRQYTDLRDTLARYHGPAH